MAKKKKETTEEVKKPKAIGPFDIIKLMFTDKQAFDMLSNNTLEKNFFMINRVMAINFPMQAECFNKMSINMAQVIRSWQTFATATCGYGRVPSFVYTKAIKSAATPDDIDKDLINSYCLHYQISLKDFNDMLLFNHDAAIAHINNFEKINSTKEQNKNIIKCK